MGTDKNVDRITGRVAMVRLAWISKVASLWSNLIGGLGYLVVNDQGPGVQHRNRLKAG